MAFLFADMRVGGAAQFAQLIGSAAPTFSVGPGSVGSTLQMGSPSASFTVPAPFAVAPGSVSSTLQIGAPSVSFVMGGVFSVAAAGIGSTLQIGVPSSSFTVPVVFSVEASGIASNTMFGTPVVSPAYDVDSLLTLAQAQQYLMMALGIEVPAFIVQAAINKASPYVPAMATAGYSQADQVMVLCISVALIAAAGMPRRLGNQAAPSGASRGFKYGDRDLTALRRSLAALDTAGIMSSVVGPDPAASTLFFVV